MQEKYITPLLAAICYFSVLTSKYYYYASHYNVWYLGHRAIEDTVSVIGRIMITYNSYWSHGLGGRGKLIEYCRLLLVHRGSAYNKTESVNAIKRSDISSVLYLDPIYPLVVEKFCEGPHHFSTCTSRHPIPVS